MKIGNLEVYGVIYKITNKVNGKVYIGQTSQPKGFKDRYSFKGEGIERVYRFYQSEYKGKRNGYNNHLFDSIKKYGFDAFEVNEVFDIAFSKMELDIKEITYIKLFKCIENGYNFCEGGYYYPRFRGEKHHNSKKIFCLTNNKSYSNAHEVERELGIHNNVVRDVCYGKINRCYDKDKNIYVFTWYSDYVDMTEEEIKFKIYKSTDEYRKSLLSKSHIGQPCVTKRKVVCLNNNKVFESVTDAMNYYGLSGLWSCLSGKTKTCGKDIITGERLKWAYCE